MGERGKVRGWVGVRGGWEGSEGGCAHPLCVAKAARVAQRHPAAPLWRLSSAARKALPVDRLLDRLEDAGLELALPPAHRVSRLSPIMRLRGGCQCLRQGIVSEM